MSGAIYGGDEVGALVLDIGHNTVRAGYGGEDSPKLDIPTNIGVWADSQDDNGDPHYKYNIGLTAIHVKRTGMELTTFLKEGMVDNWDMFENLTDHIYKNALGAVPCDHPVLITEPPWVTPPKREQMAELMFEKYKVPALYLGKNAALAAFANGRPTCLVVDSGATHTSAVPVHDGIVLTQAVVKSPVGGDYISAQCRNYLEEKNIDVIPPYMVSSKEITKPDEPASWKIKTSLPKVTDSWHNYMVKEVMQDFQASVLQVSDNLYEEEIVKSMPAIHYEFPNGFHKDFGVERFKIPEPLFNPTTSAKASIQPILGVGPLVTTSVGMCDIDIRPAMYGSVVVTGGNSNIQGFNERLNRDLAAKTPPVKPKVDEANMFATMLSDYLQNHLLNEPDTKELIIYTDSCGYQNKNANIANALLKFAIDSNVTVPVYYKYFEKGHSQMEVVSIHSAIEGRLKNRDIYLPTD